MSDKQRDLAASFIIPVYHVSEYLLRRVLESILEQTVPSFEVILIEDGLPSVEGSLCDKLQALDPRIHVIHQDNLGVSAARNTGIAAARGTWLCFVDADDWLSKDYLEVFLKHCSEAPCDIAISNYTHCVGDKELLRRFFQRPGGPFDNEERSRLANTVLIIDSGLGQVWAKLYKRQFILENKLVFNQTLSQGEDIEFNFRAFRVARHVTSVEEALYYYQLHENSAGRGFKPQYAHAVSAFIEALHVDAEHMNADGKPAIDRDLLAARSVNALFSICMNYLVHEQHPGSLQEKTGELRAFCSLPYFADSISRLKRAAAGTPRFLLCLVLRIKAYRLFIWMTAILRRKAFPTSRSASRPESGTKNKER